VGVERHQRQEVGEHEGREHAVGKRPVHERQDEAAKCDQERWADSLPEPVEKGGRRPGVALEAQPATSDASLDAEYVVQRGPEMDREVGACGYERRRGKRGGDGKPLPLSRADDDERSEQDEPRVVPRFVGPVLKGGRARR
jgi:hypothetical protein